jgi:hypothetical protein
MTRSLAEWRKRLLRQGVAAQIDGVRDYFPLLFIELMHVCDPRWLRAAQTKTTTRTSVGPVYPKDSGVPAVSSSMTAASFLTLP